MSTVIHPVGPEEPKVYWVRRLVAVLVAVVVVVLMVAMRIAWRISGTRQVDLI